MAFFQFPVISSQVLSRGNAAYTRRQEAASKKRMITTVKTAISRLKDCSVIASYAVSKPPHWQKNDKPPMRITLLNCPIGKNVIDPMGICREVTSRAAENKR